MSRTNIDLDDDAVEYVMKTYHLATKRDAVNFALNKLRRRKMTVDEMLAMRGTGWDGDLEEVKHSHVPPFDE
jgi:Arc/MetJ family transcription regulator